MREKLTENRQEILARVYFLHLWTKRYLEDIPMRATYCSKRKYLIHLAEKMTPDAITEHTDTSFSEWIYSYIRNISSIIDNCEMTHEQFELLTGELQSHISSLSRMFVDP